MAISTRRLAWLWLVRGVPRLPCSSLTCPGRHSELGPVPCAARLRRHAYSTCRGERAMFEFRDLFQWDRFTPPPLNKAVFLVVIRLNWLFGISGIFSGLAAMAISPFGGFILLLSSIASVIVGGIFSRLAAELVLIVFRINEHLGAIRDQGQVH